MDHRLRDGDGAPSIWEMSGQPKRPKALRVKQERRGIAMVASSPRRFHLPLLAALLAVLVSAVLSYAKCDPTTDPDASDIANARAAVAANCDCAGATSRGSYMSCAAEQANTVLVNKSCAGAVKKCAAHSICGKPAGAVTCCYTTTTGTKCRIKKDAAHCKGTVGTCTSCCDGCPAPGAPAGPSCPPPCSSTAFPTCGGSCPAGQTCYPLHVDALVSCVCAATGAPCCTIDTEGIGVACPPGQVCHLGFSLRSATCGGCSPSGAFLDESY
jgi:hypothetical protein